MGELYDALHGWLTGLLHWTESFAHGPYGGWALVAIGFAESSFFPIPPDALLIPLCVVAPDKAFLFAGLCSAASVAGGAAGYAIGFYGGRPLLRRLFSERRIAAVSAYYDRWNAWATGAGGLTPLPYKLFTIAGGAFAVDFKVFLLASVVSRSLRFFAVAGLIYVLGEPARQFIERHLGWLSVAFVILLVAGFWLFGRGFRRASEGTAEEER